MLKIQTILHPTDFSERSTHAFKLACALARDQGARVIVLHVAPVPVIVYGGVMTPPPPEYIEKELKEKLLQLKAPDPAVCLEHQLVLGDPAGVIAQMASEKHCDLIVMGTHGRTGLRRLLMGSVAELVMRKASCPVLTVKTPFAEKASVPGTKTAAPALA